MSPCGYERAILGGQSVTALSLCSEVDLLGDGERVIARRAIRSTTASIPAL